MEGGGDTAFWMQLQEYFQSHQAEYLTAVGEHLTISLIALLAAVCIGVPFGYYCITHARSSKWIVGFFQVLRIIPSLAFLILLIPIMGTGLEPALTALIVLAVPPILMNTAAGFEAVPDFMLETAAGLGMSDRQILWKVKVPLAMPLILAGIKTAAVEIIASATLAAKIGAGGLGEIIFTGLGLNRPDLLVIGGASVAALSLLAGLAFYIIDRLAMRYKYVKA
jgi:osmoprotectant transport system permease protein